MFIKITSLVFYFISLSALMFLTFKQSLSFWAKGENTLFFIMMIVVLVLLCLIGIGIVNLHTLYKEWQYTKNFKKDLENMDDTNLF